MNSLLTTVITSSLVATVTGALINAWMEYRKSIQSVRFDALATAIELEGYAITCAEKISDHYTAATSDGSAGSLLGSVPNLPKYSVVAGFLRPRRASIANRLLAFPQDVRQADQSIAFWWDVVGDPDAMHQEAKAQVSRIGLLSLDLACEIRKEFDLPIRVLVFGKFNIRKILTEAPANIL